MKPIVLNADEMDVHMDQLCPTTTEVLVTLPIDQKNVGVNVISVTSPFKNHQRNRIRHEIIMIKYI